MGLDSAVPWLIAGLKDKSLEVRASSAIALAEFGNREAIPPLIEIFKGA